MSSWIEQDDIALRIGLDRCPYGAQRHRSSLRVFKVGNIDIEVHLLRRRSRRPRRSHVVLHSHRGQQEMGKLDHENILGRENDLPTEQLGPKGAQRTGIGTVKGDTPRRSLDVGTVLTVGPVGLTSDGSVIYLREDLIVGALRQSVRCFSTCWSSIHRGIKNQM